MKCSSCSIAPARKRGMVLVTLDSPAGEYQLCADCLGGDLDRRLAPTLTASRGARR